MWKGHNKQHTQKQSYSNCQGESSVRINLKFQYKSVPAWEWKRNMGRDKCLVWVELLNAVVEPFIFLYNPWSIKTEGKQGKQRKTKRLRSTRVWLHAEVFTWKALVLPLVMLFSFLHLQTKNIRIFYPHQLRFRILLGHTSLLHQFLQTTMTEFDSLKARKWVSKEKEPQSPSHPLSVIITE